ncbi:hypothetical protein MVEG_04279 [Podila verticillata NRRL 6337]|nr:hypothetical protein MVEG_04279 [Podila verticillata NRRL 6337]
MKLLLKLSLATALLSSALGALSLDEFIANNKVIALAPHLVQEINTQGVESYNTLEMPPITAGLKIPLLDDIVQIVSLNIFNGKGADWSRLEAAKLKAIQENGAEALKAAANLTDVDTRQASLILNAIYDTVVAIPATTKETYAARIQAQAAAKAPKAVAEPKAEPKTEPKAAELKKEVSSSIWDVLGFSLMKSQDTVKKAKALVGPSSVCETTNTAYLKGVEEIVYYSSLTHGLAGGALANAPNDSPLKSLDLKTIISSVGKLAVEIQMAQSVARLADLNPADPLVRAITFLSLSADSPSSQDAQIARDLHNLVNQSLADLIPASVVRVLSEQAALILITRGAGQSTTASAFESVPVLRNVFAFSNEVLNANNIGDVVKFVFCPESSHVEPKETKKEESGQKVFKTPEEAAKKAAEGGKKVVENVKEGADAVKDKTSEAKKAAEDKAAEMEKAAGKKATGAKKATKQAKKSTEETVADVAEKVFEGGEEAVNVIASLKERIDEAVKTAEEASNKPQEQSKKADEAKEEL